MPEITTSEEPKIPTLDEAYSHARKAYGLVSALLIAWELIGAEFEPSPIENVKLTLKSPQAAPYVLIVLTIYFGFRLTIEWYQNDSRRRKLPASRIDFAVAHLIAITALALYLFQTLSNVQIANTAIPYAMVNFIAMATVSAVSFHAYIKEVSSFRELMKNKSSVSRFLIIALGLLGMAISIAIWKHNLNIIFVSGSGMVSGFVFALYARRYFVRHLNRS